MKQILIFAALLVLAFAAPARALSPEDTAAVQKAESYLRALDTAQARFVQTAPDGTQTTGIFYLDRPGKLRFQYDPPVKDFIVADGFFIYFYDSQLGEQTNAPIGQTLADFLLRTDLRLSGDVSVSQVRRGAGLLQITLNQTDDPAAGYLTLGFTEQPFKLKKWRVVDGQGLITEVELNDVQANLELANSLFVYRNPAKAVDRMNLNR